MGDLIAIACSGGTGEGLTVTPGVDRTTAGGITQCAIYNVGSGYTVGDQITLSGGNEDCVFEVTEIKTSSTLHGTEVFRTQNNFLVLPKEVIGVTRILRSRNFFGMGLGMGGAVPYGGLMAGNGLGMGPIGGPQFDLSSYYAFTQYLETIEWTIFPPVSFSFNKVLTVSLSTPTTLLVLELVITWYLSVMSR